MVTQNTSQNICICWDVTRWKQDQAFLPPEWNKQTPQILSRGIANRSESNARSFKCHRSPRGLLSCSASRCCKRQQTTCTTSFLNSFLLSQIKIRMEAPRYVILVSSYDWMSQNQRKNGMNWGNPVNARVGMPPNVAKGGQTANIERVMGLKRKEYPVSVGLGQWN
jgi:hypothetical protein